MNLLISPNAFKNSLSALDAAKAIKAGFVKSKLEGTFTIFPIADGGDGTLNVITNSLNGEFLRAEVEDPLGRKVEALYGYIPSLKMAVIELAAASGLHLLSEDEKDPWRASTFGTGQLIKKALDLDVKEILIGVGGSATIDAGTGLLKALGVRFTDKNGEEVSPGAQGLEQIGRIDVSQLDARLKKCKITVACDVDNPLIGIDGMAHIFGPQKGASPQMILAIDKAMAHFSEVIYSTIQIDIREYSFMGAAGGASAGLFALAGAKLENGLDCILKILNFERYLKNADLIISSEGNFDNQTLKGKGPLGLARIAKRYNIPVVLLVGKVAEDINLKDFDNIESVFSIAPGPGTLDKAIKNTWKDLERTAEQLGNLINLAKRNNPSSKGFDF